MKRPRRLIERPMLTEKEFAEHMERIDRRAHGLNWSHTNVTVTKKTPYIPREDYSEEYAAYHAEKLAADFYMGTREL